ncbi:unnamed protein product [[Candida] boidinii]|nr:unnamed protein product [[Candida] boidinii]GMF70525.1 unnamed protein product [[Candida] boidinii]
MQRLRELNESQIYNGQDELQDNHNNSLNDNIDIENQIPNNQWQKDIGIHHQNSYHNDNNNDNDDDDERLIL